MRFAVIGDSKGEKNGVNEKIIIGILKQIKKMKSLPDCIIHLGDMTAGCDDSIRLRYMLDGFRRIFVSNGIESIIIPVFGNHEEGENAKNNASEVIFSEVFKDLVPDGELEGYNKTVYFKDIDNTRLVILNSCHFGTENIIGGEQLKWLSNVLKAARDFKIVFVHIPPYPTGAHFGTSMDLYPEARDEFWSIIDENKVDIVFAGHEHNYSRRVINESSSTEKYKFNNQIYLIISGGGGEKLRDKYKSKKGVVVPPIAKNHFVVADILMNKLIIKAYDIKGIVIDEFQICK